LAWCFEFFNVREVAGGATVQRPKRARRHDTLSRRAFRTLLVLASAILLPVLLALVLITNAIKPDLFDLTPVVSHSDQYLILAWPDLERAKHALSVGAISSGTMMRALGYMMDGDRPVPDGERVQGFVLLPDAGSPIHPAHRFGDQMIDVRLRVGNEVRFFGRRLVWVWGTLRMLPGDPSGHEPLYILEEARAEPANKADIPKYFK
jgi:hypothetical protein